MYIRFSLKNCFISNKSNFKYNTIYQSLYTIMIDAQGELFGIIQFCKRVECILGNIICALRLYLTYLQSGRVIHTKNKLQNLYFLVTNILCYQHFLYFNVLYLFENLFKTGN